MHKMQKSAPSAFVAAYDAFKRATPETGTAEGTRIGETRPLVQPVLDPA
jgi:hypothetical protein